MAKKKSLVWQNCSEDKLRTHLSNWLESTNLSNTLIFLEGEMGSGKSTFVRILLEFLAPHQKSAGSPTFSLVQVYSSKQGYPIFHIDLYRMKNELELQDSGIEAQIEEQGALTCIEWASLFEDYFSYWFDEKRKKGKKVIQVWIEHGETESFRNYRIE